MRDLCRNSSFVAVNAAIFLGGALELGLAQWLPAYAEMSLGFSKSTSSISLLAFSAAMALGRIIAGLIGRGVGPIRLMLGCCWTSGVLFPLACFAPWPTVALAASVVVGLAGSCLWPTTLGVAADRFPQGGATMFGLLAALGNMAKAPIAITGVSFTQVARVRRMAGRRAAMAPYLHVDLYRDRPGVHRVSALQRKLQAGALRAT
jgi:fucose permease